MKSFFENYCADKFGEQKVDDRSQTGGAVDLKSIPIVNGACNACNMAILNFVESDTTPVEFSVSNCISRYFFSTDVVKVDNELIQGDPNYVQKVQDYVRSCKNGYLNMYIVQHHVWNNIEIQKGQIGLAETLFGCSCSSTANKVDFLVNRRYGEKNILDMINYHSIPPHFGNPKKLVRIERRILPSPEQQGVYLKMVSSQIDKNMEEFEKLSKEVENTTFSFFNDKLSWFDRIPVATKQHLNKNVGKELSEEEIPQWLIKPIKNGIDEIEKALMDRYSNSVIPKHLINEMRKKLNVEELPAWVINTHATAANPDKFIREVISGVAKAQNAKGYLMTQGQRYLKAFGSYFKSVVDSASSLWMKIGGRGKVDPNFISLYQSNEELMTVIVTRGFLTKNNFKTFGKRLPEDLPSLICKINSIPSASEELISKDFMKNGSLVLNNWVRSFLIKKDNGKGKERLLTIRQRIAKLKQGVVNANNWQKQIVFSQAGPSKGASTSFKDKKSPKAPWKNDNNQPKPGPKSYAAAVTGQPKGWQEAFAALSRSLVRLEQGLAYGRGYQGYMGYPPSN